MEAAARCNPQLPSPDRVQRRLLPARPPASLPARLNPTMLPPAMLLLLVQRACLPLTPAPWS